MVQEEKAGRVLEVFRDQITPSTQGLCITQMPVERARIQYAFKKTCILSLSNMETKEKASACDLEGIIFIVERFLSMTEGCCVLLDNLEYIARKRDFVEVMKFLYVLSDIVIINRGKFLLSLNPEGFSAIHLSILRQEFSILET
jgi:hypothetical protein